MAPDKSPFPTYWWGVELDNYRPSSGTYQAYPYDSLPPIPIGYLDGSFRWLDETPLELSPIEEKWVRDSETNFRSQFLEIRRQTATLGIELPDTALKFLSDSSKMNRVRAGTDSYWRMPDFIAPCPDHDDSFLVMIRSDSQDCLLWYLFLERRTGDHCVVATDELFGVNPTYEASGEAGAEHYITYCAPTFEEFVYREWIEHGISCAQFFAEPLTPRQEAYADFYRPPGDVSDRRPRCDVHDCVLKPGKELWFAPHVVAQDERQAVWAICKDRHSFPYRGTFNFDQSLSCCSPAYVVVDRPYCPNCRQMIMEIFERQQLTEFVELLTREGVV